MKSDSIWQLFLQGCMALAGICGLAMVLGGAPAPGGLGNPDIGAFRTPPVASGVPPGDDADPQHVAPRP